MLHLLLRSVECYLLCRIRETIYTFQGTITFFIFNIQLIVLNILTVTICIRAGWENDHWLIRHWDKMSLW